MAIILIIFILPIIFSTINFFAFLIKGELVVHFGIWRMMEIISFVILPFIYMTLDDENDCCGDSAPFSPPHLLTILIVVMLCASAYFYSSFRKIIATPVIEIVINSFIIIGILLNVFIAIQTKEIYYAILGNVPIILMLILILVKNHKLFMEQLTNSEIIPTNKLEHFALSILKLKPIMRYPIIFVICLPILFITTSLLMLLGQKPDALIAAFTETYKHGFSQWDYKCDNVNCGEHYLCSVAANGHPNIVKPLRRGIRNGGNIICNRQLLVSNAFEELIQEKLPFLHKPIRKNYNKVGNFIHKYYGVFNDKIIADFVYLLMKPLEWLFLLALYTFDKKPENRIAKQYLGNEDRKYLEQKIFKQKNYNCLQRK